MLEELIFAFYFLTSKGGGDYNFFFFFINPKALISWSWVYNSENFIKLSLSLYFLKVFNHYILNYTANIIYGTIPALKQYLLILIGAQIIFILLKLKCFQMDLSITSKFEIWWFDYFKFAFDPNF